MVTVEKDVRLLVKKELATVNEDFPLFASAYEGWAKVRAALAGVETERYMLDRYVEQRLRGLGESPGGAGRSGDRALYAGSVCRAAPLE